MTRRLTRPMVLLAVGLVTGTVGAQSPPPSPTTVRAPVVDTRVAQQEALLAAEDLVLARVIASLRLTPAQMRQLLPTLDAAQTALRQHEEETRRAIAKLRPGLDDARRALIAGKDASTRAEGQVNEALQFAAGRRRQLRSDWVPRLRRQLTSLLTAQQQPLLAETARLAAQQEENARDFRRSTAERGGGGPVGWMSRALDRVRAASDAEYPEARFRLALRLSALGGRDDAERDAGRPGLSPSDPQVQRQLAPYYGLMDRIRRMPDAEYQTSRADLALQLWSQRTGETDGRGRTASADASIDALLDRHFLSPQMPIVLRERLRNGIPQTEEPGARSQEPSDAAVASLMEDLTVLRAVNPLRLTSAQLGPLVQRLRAGAERLDQAEKADAAGWMAATRMLRQSMTQVARGEAGQAADLEFLRVQQQAAGKREAARDRTGSEVRALLEEILAPAQKALALASGRAEIARQRLARLENDDFDRVDRQARELDRLREASPRDYPQARQRFAMQMANLPGGAEIVRAYRTENQTARSDRGGGDRDGRDGLEREELRLRREQQRAEAREQLADPARRGQVRQFLALADQVRAMPPQVYQQRRTAIATQLYQAQTQVRAQTAPPEQALDAFIERYLLLPRAPIVLAERLQAMGA